MPLPVVELPSQWKKILRRQVNEVLFIGTFLFQCSGHFYVFCGLV